jgi:putative ABC transport system ATP-binding protein
MVVLRQVIGAVALQAVAGTALLTIGGWLVIEGQLTLGQLVASRADRLDRAGGIRQDRQAVGEFLRPAGGRGQARSPDRPAFGAGWRWDHPQVASGAAIHLHEVDFAHNGGPGLLNGLNLEIRVGERICIVGGHGSGKSTLADLLYGLRQPTQGRIEIDGVDVRELKLETLRRHVSLVKGLEMIEGTIEDNIRMNRADVSSADARAALADVGLLDEFRELPTDWQLTCRPPARRCHLVRLAG